MSLRKFVLGVPPVGRERGRWQRIRDRRGTDVTVDHDRRAISGKVAMPRAGACPHRLMATGEDGMREPQPCIGEAGHLGTRHCDKHGRTWT